PVGILFRPTEEFFHRQTFYSIEVSSDEEDYYCHNYEQGQNLKCSCKETIQRISDDGSQKAVGSENTVNHNFQQFNVDDHKTYVNKKVKDRRNGSLSHLALPHSHFSHGFPAVTGAVRPVNGTAQFNVSVNFFQTSEKQSETRNQGNQENNIVNILHIEKEF